VHRARLTGRPHRRRPRPADRGAPRRLLSRPALRRRLVVLEALNDDQNVGAIARAARAFGVDGMIISPNCNDPYQRRTVRVSMGEILHVPVARAGHGEWPGALRTLHDAGFDTWAMTPDSSAVDIWDMEVSDRIAIVLGAEGHGLDVETMNASAHRVRISISADVDSLNVGHAAAIALAAIGRPPPARSRLTFDA